MSPKLDRGRTTEADAGRRVPGLVLAPLSDRRTYRRATHLLLGGVLALPYALLAYLLVWLAENTDSLSGIVLLLTVSVVVAGIPPFLHGTRDLQIAAARALLGADLPQPEGGSPTVEARLRSALWFGLHLVVGGLVLGGIAVVVPAALSFVTGQVGGEYSSFRFGPWDGRGPLDLLALGLIGLVALLAVVLVLAALGRLATMMAPVLLGPSTAERVAALEREAGALAERNRLARELHDSIGHALTVTTVQAAAAREVLDQRPEFVRQALVAVEETGRQAMDDLDHVLGLLREEDSAGVERLEPTRTLNDLHDLARTAGDGGLEVRLELDGDPGRLRPVVSREGYRVVQEFLTNATRHGAEPWVSLRVRVGPGDLVIEAVNPRRQRRLDEPDERAGRGLLGVAERVRVLGGRMWWNETEAEWRVGVRLPHTSGRHGRKAS